MKPPAKPEGEGALAQHEGNSVSATPACSSRPEPAQPALALADGVARRLDDQALARLRELDPDGRHGVLRRVLSAFEASLLRMLGQLSEAGERADGAAVAALAHTMKSSSASVGALALSALCASAERDLRTGGVQDLPALVHGLSAEVVQVLAAVRAMLQA
jgi:HPt (histidine-containing phosphotransfer) domain-containing protein